MNYRKSIGTASVALFGMILLTKYQNCAPTPSQAMGSPENPSGEVRIIEDWQQEKVIFAEERVTLHSEADTVDFPGLCSKDQFGSHLDWHLRDENEAHVESGQAGCQRGGFEISVKDLSLLNCQEEYILEIVGGDGEKDLIQLQRRCPPDAVTMVLSEGLSQCDIERASNSCTYACYTGKRLVSQRELPMSECQSSL